MPRFGRAGIHRREIESLLESLDFGHDELTARLDLPVVGTDTFLMM